MQMLEELRKEEKEVLMIASTMKKSKKSLLNSLNSWCSSVWQLFTRPGDVHFRSRRSPAQRRLTGLLVTVWPSAAQPGDPSEGSLKVSVKRKFTISYLVIMIIRCLCLLVRLSWPDLKSFVFYEYLDSSRGIQITH